jgi:biotin-(acetyl-CoA carboxylase) ligase
MLFSTPGAVALQRGARVTWSTPTGPLNGVTAGIDEHGALLVRTGQGIVRIIGGEVAWGSWE